MPTSTAGRSLLARTAALGLAIIAPHSALAATGTHSTLASFQQNIRADFDVEPFDGPDALAAPSIVGLGGYAYGVRSSSDVQVIRRASGVCATFYDQAVVFTFTGRPVTAFAGTFRLAIGPNSPTNIAGNFVVQTSTGLSFLVSVPAGGGGTFFGFTSSEPFTSVVIADVAGANYEFVDDVYVGTSGTATAAADGCDDAPILTLLDSNAFPFTTVGATAQAIGGVCDSATDTGPDVWYRFVPTSNGLATITTCGCDFDSILRVFGSCLIAGSGQHLACNDDDCTGGGGMQASRVQLRVDAGFDYLIRISGYGGASGSGNLTITLLPDCPGDANHSGGLEVQDIFDFLNFWFAGCP